LKYYNLPKSRNFRSPISEKLWRVNRWTIPLGLDQRLKIEVEPKMAGRKGFLVQDRRGSKKYLAEDDHRHRKELFLTAGSFDGIV